MNDMVNDHPCTYEDHVQEEQIHNTHSRMTGGIRVKKAFLHGVKNLQISTTATTGLSQPYITPHASQIPKQACNASFCGWIMQPRIHQKGLIHAVKEIYAPLDQCKYKTQHIPEFID